MSILNDQTQVSNMAILVGALTYIIKLFIEKKYGLRFASDTEMIEHILDRGIDKAMVATPKLQVLKNKIFGDSEAKKTIEPVPLPVKEMQREVNNVRVDTGMVLSGMQLEMDHLKDKLTKTIPGLDLSNGNDKEEEKGTIDKDSIETEPASNDSPTNEDYKRFLPPDHPDYDPPKK